jgi:hypothetical protein
VPLLFAFTLPCARILLLSAAFVNRRRRLFGFMPLSSTILRISL